MKTAFILYLIASCTGIAVNAQQGAKPNPSQPEFSVASVRPSSDDVKPTMVLTDTGIIERSNSLMYLLELAYQLPEERLVVGAPKWIRSETFDITAKVDDSDVARYNAMPKADRVLLLQTVLKDRFHLLAHFEPRTLPEYALVVADSGLTASRLTSSPPNQKLVWHISGRYHLEADSVAMQDVCLMLLSTEAQQPVVDQTGLSGKYSFQLSWSRESPDGKTSTSDAPNIFAAVRQLGLKLVPIKAPVQVLVIDHVERPSSN